MKLAVCILLSCVRWCSGLWPRIPANVGGRCICDWYAAIYCCCSSGLDLVCFRDPIPHPEYIYLANFKYII
uniref:MIP16286p n=1 Tax=Drosophila melanogaster TaxID=7227 RepID=D3DMN2_DROME|nr:MIP16286p [Drosophila melanogaster]